MAYTTINKSTDNFNTKLYTGNSSTNAITGIGHQPDLVWMKNRGAGDKHYLFDAVRGVTKSIYSNLTSAEATTSNGLTAFGTDGFTLGNEGDINGNGNNFVSWNWKAGAGAGSANTDGSINTTSTSVNTTAGFSISKYTGNGSNPSTVGHGLGVAPKMIIIKNLDQGTDWQVYHASTGNTKGLLLNSTAAAFTSSFWGDTTPTNSVFTLGVGDVNTNNINYIAYCFAEKAGYSKFGSYTGNGNADGTFIYTGFRPAFILSKKSSGSGTSWTIWDNKRSSFNPADKILHPNNSNPDNTADDTDFLSNGFKLRATASGMNNSGDTYIYIAFGQSIVGSNNVPATAR